MNKNILKIDYFHIELGHTLEEYKKRFGSLYDEGDLWDYSLEDVKTNAFEGDCNTLYWGIVVDEKLRVFETTIQEEFEINYQLLQDYIWYVYLNDRQNTVVEVYNERMGTDLPNTKKSVIDTIIQDKEFLKIVYQEECLYCYEWLSKHNCYEERYISFENKFRKLIVKTNAPSFLIKEAISYKDLMLENNIPNCNSFECVQEYIQEKGFKFEKINVSSESYYW